jgi:transcriptional accessory protein Tex/SPT6
MNPLHIEKIAAELSIKPAQVRATAALLEEGGTVPFIARYRKEATGSLDEVAIAISGARRSSVHWTSASCSPMTCAPR